jgi:hypothetical protein
MAHSAKIFCVILVILFSSHWKNWETQFEHAESELFFSISQCIEHVVCNPSFYVFVTIVLIQHVFFLVVRTEKREAGATDPEQHVQHGGDKQVHFSFYNVDSAVEPVPELFALAEPECIPHPLDSAVEPVQELFALAEPECIPHPALEPECIPDPVLKPDLDPDPT